MNVVIRRLLTSAAVGLLLAAAALPAAAIEPKAGLTALDTATMVRRAGYVFAGTVLEVRHEAPSKSGGIATVRLVFRVDEAVRGVWRGQTLTVREWAGLWQAGERYRVGERVFLFLHPVSRLGLTSPLGGPAGRLAVDSGSSVLDARRLSDDPQLGPRLRSGKAITSRSLARALRRMAKE